MIKKIRGGFTLIELSLSLIFIAILSLTVVLLIQNISASYRRGLVLNQINTIGMDLIDDFRISIQGAASNPIDRTCEIYYPDHDVGGADYNNYKKCTEDNADSFVSVNKMAKVKVEGDWVGGTESESELPVYGAFCTGTYTYIWNTGYFPIENDDNIDFAGTPYGKSEIIGDSEAQKPAVVGTKSSSTASFNEIHKNFRLLRIYDGERSVCINAMEGQTGKNVQQEYKKKSDYAQNKITHQFIIDDAEAEAAEVLKRDKATDLVLYELYVAKPAASDTRENFFYATSFILGTRRGGLNVKRAGESCKPPNNDFSELEYCAINKFNFAVMAGGF